MAEGRSVVLDGQTYTRAGDGSWVDEANIEAAVGIWGKLDRALEATGFLARRAGARHPRSFRQDEADRYFVRRAGETRFHYRGLAVTAAKAKPNGACGFCCRCGRKPVSSSARLHVIEDKRNPGEFFEYGADCWEGAMKAALAEAVAAETDQRRARMLAQNYRLFFEDYDAASNTCPAANEYWDPAQPAGPQGRDR